MSTAAPVQTFNSPRGRRLARNLLLWAAVTLWYGLVVSWRETDWASRALWTLFQGGGWGLLMLGFWLFSSRELTVGTGSLWRRSWLGSLFHTGGSTYPLEEEDVLVRRRNGEMVLRPNRRESVGTYLPASDWPSFAAAVQAQGVSVVDERASWETANPQLLHRQAVLSRLARVWATLGMALAVGWTFPTPAQVVIAVACVVSFALAVGLAIWSWELNSNGVMPGNGEAHRGIPAKNLR